MKTNREARKMSVSNQSPPSDKWIPDEVMAIAAVRRRLHKELSSCPQFPEVVGDRRILRFLRGKQMNVDAAVKVMRDFLIWRKENNVDEIRQEIVYGGKNTPFKFPKGKLILQLAPQIVITAKAVDRAGRPLSMELFDFDPKEIARKVQLEEYLLWLTYALEYRTLVMEQLSQEYEQAYLRDHPDPSDRQPGWGVVLLDITIRDLKGVGWNHLSSDGRAVVGAALKLGLNNYLEFLGRGHFVNVPWIFTSMWTFVKLFLDEYTLAKLQMSGSEYLDDLQTEMSIEHIPVALGGKFDLFNEPFDFDVSPSSTLYYEGCEADSEKYLEKRREFEAQDKEEYCYYWGGVTPQPSITAATSAPRVVSFLPEEPSVVIVEDRSNLAWEVISTTILFLEMYGEVVFTIGGLIVLFTMIAIHSPHLLLIFLPALIFALVLILVE